MIRKKISLVILLTTVIMSNLNVISFADSIRNTSNNEVLSNEINQNNIITLSQRGDVNDQKYERRQIFAGGNLDLTGYYVMPGESVEVYVDANKYDILPKLVFAQVGEIDNDNKNNYKKFLEPGRNIVTAPQGTKGYAIYFENSACPDEQSYAPRIRISGKNIKSYPIYIDGKTDPKKYIEQVKNHRGANMTDVMGERFLISSKNSEAKIAYIDRGKSPKDAVKSMEILINSFDKLAGYDKNDKNPIHRPTNGLYHYKGTDGSGLFATNEYIHYPSYTARDLFSGDLSDWGIGHEFGHQIENRDMRLIEVTNNLFSLAAQKPFGRLGRDFSDYQSNIDKYFTFEGSKGFGGFDEEYDLTFGLFERLLVITQITNYFGDEAYAKASRLIRENTAKYATGAYQSIITAMSEATGYDLSSHFEYYNYPVTYKTKKFTSKFKKLNKKIRYTTIDTYKKIQENIQTFNNKTKAIINNVKKEEDGFTLNISTNDNNEGTIAYEIYRDGKFIGFTRENKYKDVVNSSKEYKYEIIAYDYRANESIKSNPVNTSSIIYKPILIVDDTISIEKNSKFNPLEYVKATSYDNKEIDKSKIKIIDNNVDTGKLGKYEVTYEVEDKGFTQSKNVSVFVYQNLDLVKFNEFNGSNNYKPDLNIPIKSIKNNAGHLGNRVINNAIDNNLNTYWQTNKRNSILFKNEVIFDLGNNFDVGEMVYAPKSGGQGFAKKFEIYTSDKENGDDFVLIGKGQYNGSVNDIIKFKLSGSNVRRIKFKFLEANQDWAAIKEIAIYKKEKVKKEKLQNLANKFISDLENGLDNSAFTSESWHNYVRSFDEAKLGLADENISQEEVDILVRKFIEAEKGLTLE